MGYLTCGPDSNEMPRQSKHPWAEENEFVDVVALALNNKVQRCEICERWTRPKYLTEGRCPDCEKL